MHCHVKELLKYILPVLPQPKHKILKEFLCHNQHPRQLEQVFELSNQDTFLLVLDDVWNEDHDKWDDLKQQLLKINSKNGNAVVVTTRIKEVADTMKTSPGSHHEPGQLSDDQCWSIIKQKVSRGGRETIASDLETIGKEIAKKCGGIPLLAKVLGGTLHGKQAQEWQSILNSRIWDSQDGNKVLLILRLSFDHLSSPSLKKCFAYCSIFPKDFKIAREELVQLGWPKVILGHQIGGWKTKATSISMTCLQIPFSKMSKGMSMRS